MKNKHLNSNKYKLIKATYSFFILTTKKLVSFLNQLHFTRLSLSVSRVKLLLDCAEKLFVRFSKLYGDKGPKWTVEHFKLVYNIGTRVSLGLTFSPIPWTRSSKDGFPSIICDFRQFLTSDNIWEKRLALTCIRLYPLIVLPISRDVSNITTEAVDNPERAQAIKDFGNFIKTFVKVKLKYKPEIGYDASYSLGSGPNGPALLNSHLDVYALKKEGLFPTLLSFFNLVKHPLKRSFEYIDKIGPEGIDTSKLKSAKISFLPESGGKTRVIAVVDFWTQQLLRPIHIALMDLVRDIPMDGTFNQNAAFSRLLKQKDTKFSASFDLSAATDRFPIRPQYVLISVLFGIPIANHWVKLLVDRDYAYMDADKQEKKIRWKVGQPLGAYSSWITFSITHHLLIQYCAYLCSDKSSFVLWSFTDYVLLGDDIVILDEAVAKQYELLLGQMGVIIHPLKSFVAHGHCGEFTKRLFWHGKEISPLPITIFRSIKESLYNVPQFLEMITERWKIPTALVGLWAVEHKIFTKKTNLLTLILGFRSLINGGNSFPWCLEDRPQVLKGLREYIFENVALKVDYYGNEMVLDTTSWSKEKRKDKLSIKCFEDLEDALKQSQIVVPTSLLVESQEWGEEAFSPRLHPIMHAYMFTFKKMEQRVDRARELRYSGDISPHYRELSRVELASLDLFFIKTKRRRTIRTTQLAVKFITGLIPDKFSL